jgi:hypothetical protein
LSASIALQTDSLVHVRDGFYAESRITALDVGRQGQLYYGTQSGRVGIVDLPSDQDGVGRTDLHLWQTGQFSYPVMNLTASPDGTSYAVDQATGDPGGPVYLLSENYLLHVLTNGGLPQKPFFSSDGAHVFLPASYSEEADLFQTYQSWSTRYGSSKVTNLYSIENHLLDSGFGAFGRQGSQYLELVGPDGDGEVVLRERVERYSEPAKMVAKWTPKAPLWIELERGRQFAWSGITCATRSGDRKTMNVYSILTGKLVKELRHPEGMWWQEFFLVEPNLLIAPTARGQEFWDIETGRHILTLRLVYDGRGQSLFALTPDGSFSRANWFDEGWPSPEEVFPHYDGDIIHNADLVRSAYLQIQKILDGKKMEHDYIHGRDAQ